MIVSTAECERVRCLVVDGDFEDAVVVFVRNRGPFLKGSRAGDATAEALRTSGGFVNTNDTR